MKRKIYNPRNKKKPSGFIPRKDLFPDEAITEQKENPFYTIRQDKQDITGKNVFKEPESFKTNRAHGRPENPTINGQLFSDPTIIILLLFSGLYLWPLMVSDNKDRATFKKSAIQSSILDVVDNPNAIKMLHAVCPYLGDKEQDAIYTIIGIQEVLATVRDLLNHSYQTNRQSRALAVPADPVEKRIEMIKVLKPYIPEVGRNTMGNVIHVYDTYNKLNKNINKYRRKRKSDKGKSISSIEAFTDMVDIINPVLPADIQSKTSKLISLMKMAEAMEHSEENVVKEMAGATNLENPATKVMTKDAMEKSNGQSTRKTDIIKEGTSQAERIKNALAPMLDEEQKGTLGLIMRMSQLLAEPEEENRKIE